MHRFQDKQKVIGVSELRFEWDPRKAATNLRRHGVSFEEAESVFLDDEALLIGDPDHSEKNGG